MEIYLNENKAKDNNIDIESCYKKIDNYFLTRGVVKVAKGIYKGAKEDFTTFAVAQGQLPDTNCFLKLLMSGILVILEMDQIVQNIDKMHQNHIIVLKRYMMIMLETKKALNFDISDSLLKQYYPSKSYKNGWKDINKYLVR